MIRAIVLAAGRSRRMGTQKLLLPYGGKTVIAHIVNELNESGVASVLVVVGPHGKLIAEQAARCGAAFVINTDEHAEMLSSVRCGLVALDPCEAVLFVLGDQPSIASQLVDKMIDAYAEVGRGIIVPVYNGRRGHPLLVSTHYIDEILHCYDDRGLRGLLEAHPEEVYEIPVPSDGVLSDMDVPADYRREIARLEENREA